MKLTIGIPFFNSEEYIGRCLESIVELEGIIDYEILCLDDGSIDNSYKFTYDKHGFILYAERRNNESDQKFI